MWQAGRRLVRSTLVRPQAKPPAAADPGYSVAYAVVRPRRRFSPNFHSTGDNETLRDGERSTGDI